MSIETERLSWALFIAALLTAGMSPVAQAAADSELEYRNNIGLFAGGATVFADEREHTSLLGLEYERRFTPYWGLGAVAEISVGDFERSHLLGVGATVRPMAGGFRLALLLCTEFIDEEALENADVSADGPKPLFRTGISYEFEIGRFTIEPAIAADTGGETDLILNIGLLFGVNF